jgi:hypothetical protein
MAPGELSFTLRTIFLNIKIKIPTKFEGEKKDEK